MTVSLAAVFIPVLFMGGILGRLFREFAVTIMHGDLDLRPGLHHADAHAVQPVPERSAPAAAQSWFSRTMEGFFNCTAERLQAQPARRAETSLRDGRRCSSS